MIFIPILTFFFVSHKWRCASRIKKGQRTVKIQEKLVLCVNKNAEYDIIANEIDDLREKIQQL